MTTLVVGASGKTGKQLVEQLLIKGLHVKVIVRSLEGLPESWKSNASLSIIEASILDLTENEVAKHIQNCDAIASCLGHNISLKGIYGEPRRLVTDAVSLLCNAIRINSPDKVVKMVLMNTAGNSNRGLDEPISNSQKLLLSLIRLLLPPHSDNEKAADYLRLHIGKDDRFVEWTVVRPDSLINEDHVTEYEAHPSPIRSALFDPGKTSRINVGHFMAELITEDHLWMKWKGKMPVLYNK